jgi:DNA-binding transcriptional LysR family regulator
MAQRELDGEVFEGCFEEMKNRTMSIETIVQVVVNGVGVILIPVSYFRDPIELVKLPMKLLFFLKEGTNFSSYAKKF